VNTLTTLVLGIFSLASTQGLAALGSASVNEVKALSARVQMPIEKLPQICFSFADARVEMMAKSTEAAQKYKASKKKWREAALDKDSYSSLQRAHEAFKAEEAGQKLYAQARAKKSEVIKLSAQCGAAVRRASSSKKASAVASSSLPLDASAGSAR
jgi:hypothetical protein